MIQAKRALFRLLSEIGLTPFSTHGVGYSQHGPAGFLTGSRAGEVGTDSPQGFDGTVRQDVRGA